MKFWSRIWRAAVGADPLPAAAPAVAPEPPARQTKRGRPASTALLRTLEIVRKRPEITPRELSAELKVTAAYARTLLRRAASRPQAEPATVDPVAASVARLEERLQETERTLSALRTTPPNARSGWNLNRRAEVLRLAEAGEGPAQIAGALSIPPGEVEFILKIARLLHASG